MPRITARLEPMRAIKSDPGTAAMANNASGSPINSPTWVSDMCNSPCTCGITGGMARIVMRMATPASQSTNMSLTRRPTGRPSRLAAEVMEWKPGVGRQPASAGATAQETAPHRCFALARVMEQI
jgi:hypothetical protein